GLCATAAAHRCVCAAHGPNWRDSAGSPCWGTGMNPEKFAFTVGVAVFVGGSLGLILHRILPEKHKTGGGKDMIGAVVGLLTLLSALVLGLLIWTAYGVYAGQNVAIQTLAAKALQLDLALADYGAEAKDARAQLRQGLGKTIDEIWASNESDA